MKSETRDTLIWLFCIIIVIILIGKISSESNDYNCSECTVTFTNTRLGGPPFEFGTYQIQELFTDFIESGACSIKWDPEQGYYNG